MSCAAGRFALLSSLALAGALAGCANPGPPKPPSLGIPAMVTDLVASRRGNAVDLQFTLPSRTTDGIALRAGSMTAALCRAIDTGTCVPLPGVASFAVPSTPKTPGTMRDALPANLSMSAPRLLTYRISFRSADGKTAGFSDAAYALAGSPPPPIADLHAQGSRLGVVLTWKPVHDGSAVLLTRENLSQNQTPSGGSKIPAANRKASSKQLFADMREDKQQAALITLKAAGDATDVEAKNAGATLDTGAQGETPYSYKAERRRTVELAGRKLEMWSELSAPVAFTLHDTFPPPIPKSVSVAGFNESETKFAVDLIWEPVEDEQLAGYKVYRETLDESGAPEKKLLTQTPVKLPAFHDTTGNGSRRYRYSVTSIDLKGNESEAATAILEPQKF